MLCLALVLLVPLPALSTWLLSASKQAELRGQVQRLSARLASHEAAELAGTSCMMQHDAEVGFRSQ